MSICPLIPDFGYKTGDELNANNWWFHWLIVKIWTLEFCHLGFDIDISFDRIGFGLILPYLRLWIGFNDLPINDRIYSFFVRKSAIKKIGT